MFASPHALECLVQINVYSSVLDFFGKQKPPTPAGIHGDIHHTFVVRWDVDVILMESLVYFSVVEIV